MSGLYFPKPSQDPPVESRFHALGRQEDGDSPEEVYLWASAVLRQLARHRQAAQASVHLERLNRYEEGVHADEFFEAWCVERAELHFLMEAVVQMCRWATMPHATDKAWESRRPLYDPPGGLPGRWVKSGRDALVHLDEAYRGIPRAQQTVTRAESVRLDLNAIEAAARHLVEATSRDY